MGATIWGQRDGIAIIPYARFHKAMAEFPEGVRLRIKIDKDRNGKFSALFHVLLGLLVDAINRGPAQTDIDKLKQWVKLKKGHYDVVQLPNPVGEITHAIDFHSTSFAKMGDTEFHAFCVDACELILAELAPWVAGSPEWPDAQQIICSILPVQVSGAA